MDLRTAYTYMLTLRTAEEELVKYFLEHKVFSMVHFYVGQEAVATGVSDALTGEDQTMGTHRSHGYYLAKGGNFKKLVAEMFGRAAGVAHGKGGSMHMVANEVGFAGTTPLLGSGVPLAAGLAFAQKYQNKNGVVAVFFGDGASEEGVVYETYNLAALYKLPILFVLENNRWSINSTLEQRRSPAYNIQKVAEGLGLTFARADGNNYEDVHTKAVQLVEGLRAGKGPALLECMVYRHMAHSTPLMEENYRTQDVLEERLKEDPIQKVKAILIAQGVSETELTKEEEDMRVTMRADIAWAAEQPYPNTKELNTNTYA